MKINKDHCRPNYIKLGRKDGKDFRNEIKGLGFKFNDGGRKLAEYKGFTGDCITRSICITTGLSYQKVYDDLTNASKEFRLNSNTKLAYGLKPKEDSARLGVYKPVYRPYILGLGFKWKPTMFIGKGCKVHLRYDDLPNGKIICVVSKHLVAVIDKVIQDTYDCSRQGDRCVYGYFYK